MSRTDRSDVQPFLAAIQAPGSPTRARAASPLASSLPALAVPTGTSPWSPRPTAELVEPAPAIERVSAAELEAIRSDARDHGRADGLRETEQLRARLAALVDELAAARAAVMAPAAELIADAATAVIAAWTETTDRGALFAPIVRGWLARCQTEATARVHPAEVAAMRGELGDAQITVIPDETVARGDVKIRAAALELSHAWEPRLRELREAIATALEEAP